MGRIFITGNKGCIISRQTGEEMTIFDYEETLELQDAILQGVNIVHHQWTEDEIIKDLSDVLSESFMHRYRCYMECLNWHYHYVEGGLPESILDDAYNGNFSVAYIIEHRWSGASNGGDGYRVKGGEVVRIQSYGKSMRTIQAEEAAKKLAEELGTPVGYRATVNRAIMNGQTFDLKNSSDVTRKKYPAPEGWVGETIEKIF